MVIDTSALVAVVLGEADAERYTNALERSTGTWLSAVNLAEASIVVEARQGPEAARDLELLVDSARVTVPPFNVEDVASAVDAWRRFGKGRHPAGLNFGDCFAYALARTLGEPLLFKGNDFRQTDIIVVI